MIVAFIGAAMRVAGGWLSDHFGGVTTLSWVLAIVGCALAATGFASGSLVLTTVTLMACFAALGAGNGALFQLVPLRWPATTAVAGSMIGELGALAGGLVPNAMGLSKQFLGTTLYGFLLLAVLALLVLVVMRALQGGWTSSWVGPGGRAHGPATHPRLLEPAHAEISGMVRS
jgi:NNP family nitrate/nitrite transporter-like MFS transporter